jgi:hypothetical protein
LLIKLIIIFIVSLASLFLINSCGNKNNENGAENESVSQSDDIT